MLPAPKAQEAVDSVHAFQSSPSVQKKIMPPTRNANKHPSRHDFEALGFALMRREQSRAGKKTRMRRFISWFGAEPVFLAITWRKLHKSGWLEYAGKRPKPEHLLWTFMWLKSYHNEEISAGLAGVDEKTFRDKVWFYVEGIARLDTAIVSPACI